MATTVRLNANPASIARTKWLRMWLLSDIIPTGVVLHGNQMIEQFSPNDHIR